MLDDQNYEVSSTMGNFVYFFSRYLVRIIYVAGVPFSSSYIGLSLYVELIEGLEYSAVACFLFVKSSDIKLYRLKIS